MQLLHRKGKKVDLSIFGVLILLAVFACVALVAATYGKTAPGLPSLSKQILFEVLGVVALIVAATMDYRNLRKARWWIYGICVFLSVVVLFMPSRFGAHSWIPLPLFSFQPSEFMKLGLIVLVAHYMADIDESEFPEYGVKKSLPVLGMFIVPFALTMKEPALGQALVMAAIVFIMYLVFARRAYFVMLLSLSVMAVVGLTVVALEYPKQSTVFIRQFIVGHHLMKMYQAERIITWLNPNYSLNNWGYNIHQAQIAVGAGQVFGEGLFNGIATRGGWIPNQWTDYIFTAIAEEFGFVGSSLLILLFLFLIDRLVRIAAAAQDPFGTYLVMGIVGMFGFQVFENIGMNMYLSPSTGITLPFISYGGSSLIANYLAVGLAISVSLRHRVLRFQD